MKSLLAILLSIFTFIGYSQPAGTVVLKSARIIIVNPTTIVVEPVPVAPSAPSNGVVDDNANTFDWQFTSGLTNISQYESSVNGGAYATVTAKPLFVGDITIAPGGLALRVKAMNGNPPSAPLYNATGFTTIPPPSPVAPNPPTNPVVNDNPGSDYFDWTNNPLYTALNQYEKSLNGGPWTVVTAKPIVIGDVPMSVGAVQVRVKAMGINPASTAIGNATAFTVYVPPSGAAILGNFDFALDTSYMTSAGVYAKDGTLIRTLWSGQRLAAGNYTSHADSLDDNGQVYDRSNVDYKILKNNVTYVWEGTFIGNTGTYAQGSKKIRTFEPPRSISILNGYLYWAGSFNEGNTSHLRQSESDPNDHLEFLEPGGANCMATDIVCTDGVRMYWAGYDPNGGAGNHYHFDQYGNYLDGYMETFINAHNLSDESEVNFAAGVPVTVESGHSYGSVISYKNTYFYENHVENRDSSVIRGMAVQKTGNFLFASRPFHNELQVMNKVTGALVRTITMAAPEKMVVDNSDNLWLSHAGILEKYVVNGDGSLTSTGQTINVATVGAIAINPLNGNIAVADIDAQIVRVYNSSLTQIGTIGEGVSYQVNADVHDNKFYWKDVRQTYNTYLTYSSTGDLYVGDQQNIRTQVFAANGTLVKSFGWRTATYGVQSLIADPTRMFAELHEYQIDYTKPLGGTNGSWKLLRNWKANLGSEYLLERNIGNIVVLSNGRTYGLASGIGNLVNSNYVVELVAGGAVRNTGILLGQRRNMGIDGSVYADPIGNQPYETQLYKYPLLGFDNNNNPIWDFNTSNLIASKPAGDVIRNPPFGGGLTESGNVIMFNAAANNITDNTDFHLGAIKLGTNKYLWKTSRGTSRLYTGPFPEDGAFDNGNNVNYGGNGAGGGALTFGNNILWNYHGEFWKGMQTNKWNHVDGTTGLFIGQFGTANKDFIGQYAPYGGDGNCLSGSYVEVNGQGYLYHNGETFGIHRWRVNRLNTIQVINATTPTSNAVPIAGIDLLDGIVWGMTTLPNGFHGWTRSKPDQGYDGSYNSLTLLGTRSYDPFKHPDLRLSFQLPNDEVLFTRDLGDNTGLNSWAVKGIANHAENVSTEYSYHGGATFQVQDALGRAITEFQIKDESNDNQNVFACLMGNRMRIHPLGVDYPYIINYNQPFEMSCSNGTLKISYAGFSLTTTNTLDAGADWHNPKYLVWRGWNDAATSPRIISIQELKFYNNSNQ